MFVSYKWLQDYVDLSGINATELADKITKSGIEVEGVEKRVKGLKESSSGMSLNVNSIQMRIN